MPLEKTDRISHRGGPAGDMWNAFARSVRDNVAAESVVQTLRIGGMIVLARALRPADFGLFRVLMVVSVIAGLTTQTGIPDALIQRRDVTAEHESTAWWLSAVIALFSVCVLYAAAPLISFAMAMPALTASVRLLCIPLFLEGTAVTASACLRRRLRFGVLAIADIVSEVVFLMTALVLLWRGEASWSLPAAWAARLMAHALALWIAAPLLPRTMPTRKAARDFARFTSAVWSGQFIYAFSSNADYLMVGRLLGSSALGLYSIAWDLLRFVPERLSRVAGRVTLPAFSQLQDDREALAHAYTEFFSYAACIVLPFAACASIAAPEVLATIYGSKWLGAALPMRLLAPGLAMCGLRLGMGSVFYARNRPGIDFYLHGTRLAAIIVTILSLSRWGLPAVSAGMSGLEFGISVAGQIIACTLVEMSFSDLAVASIRGVRLTILCMLATFAGRSVAMIAGLPTFGVLLLAIIPAILTYAWVEGSNVIQTVSRAFGSRTGERQTDVSPIHS